MPTNNVKLDETQRKNLGGLVCDYIQAALDTQGRAPEWWEACRKVHRNEGNGDRDYSVTSVQDDGMPKFHVPFSQPRLDMLTAQVCTVVGKQEPYMLCPDDDDEEGDACAEVLHRVWADASFERRIRTASNICVDTDLVYYRVCSLGDGSIEISVHDPSEVAVFPAIPSGLADATIVGHRLWKPRRAITAGKDSGRYYADADAQVEGTPESVDRTGAYDRAGTDTESGPQPDLDALIQLWDCVVRLDLDGKEKLYRCTVAFDDRELLALEPYPYRRVWYFESRYIGSPIYHPVTSVGRNLFPLQDAYDELNSALYVAIMEAAAPPIIGPKLSNGQKFEKTTFGQYIETETGGNVQPWAPSSNAQVGAIPIVLQGYDRVGDQVARISQNTSGADVGSQTATEASIVAAGVAVGLEEYISNFTAEFPEMAQHTMELVYTEFDKFARRFGLADPGDDTAGLLETLSALMPSEAA